MKSVNLLLVLAFLLPFPVAADDSAGALIYRQCVNCHGVDGMGGKGGEYPRIAGLPRDYLALQLENFKQGKRANKPMLPVFTNEGFDEKAIDLVAGHVAKMPLDRSRLPGYVPAEEILALFDSQEQFADVGAAVFQDCVQCYGEDAKGKPDKQSPPLVDQHPPYLRKQIDDFARGNRGHEHADSLFGELEPDEVEALLGYIVSLGGP